MVEGYKHIYLILICNYLESAPVCTVLNEDNQAILDRKASDEGLGGEALHANPDIRLYITGTVMFLINRGVVP